jgi:hypothetical protein
MDEFLSVLSSVNANVINQRSLMPTPRRYESLDVYFGEDRNSYGFTFDDDKISTRNVGDAVIGDVSSQCDEMLYGTSSSINSFFDLSGCLIIGDIHGNLMSLLHISELIDRMMEPYLKFGYFIYFFFFLFIFFVPFFDFFFFCHPFHMTFLSHLFFFHSFNYIVII